MSILVGLAIGIGFVLLIVPGILAMLFFMFSTVIVIDRDLGPIEAMKESMRIGRGCRWSLLGLVVLLALIVFVGMLALFVGLLVAMPVATLAFIHAYRVLSGTMGVGPSRRMQGSRLSPNTSCMKKAPMKGAPFLGTSISSSTRPGRGALLSTS